MSATLEVAGAGARRAPALCFEGVAFHYPGTSRPALEGIDLGVCAGEVTALVGRNGSGKSTLAHLSNGLRVPSRGTVTVDGIATTDDARLWDLRARVGLLFQDPNQQIVGATVEEDVAFGLENLGVPRAEMRERVEGVLADLALIDVRERPVHGLSGGQKQRLALAGVLVLTPSVLVVDEPTSLLDAGTSREFLTLVRGLAQRGTAVLWITQDADEVLSADRVAVLEEGRLLFQGQPDEWFSSEASLRLGLGLPRAAHLARELAHQPGFEWLVEGRLPLTEPLLLQALRERRDRQG